MNLKLFWNTVRRNIGLWSVFAVLQCMYLSVIITLIDPADMEQIKELFGTMEGYMGAFGIDIAAMTDPLAYTASTFYSLLVVAFTMIYYVIQNMQLIAKPVENGSMAYTLSMPISREKVAVTQGIYVIVAMFGHAVVMLLTGLICLSGMSSYMQDNWAIAYLDLVGVTLCLATMVGMLSYFLSVAFCTTKLGAGLAAGVPIGLLIISMLGGAGGESTKWLEKCSPFGWIDSVGIVSGEVNTLPFYFIFIGVTVILLSASVFVFKKKRLAI